MSGESNSEARPEGGDAAEWGPPQWIERELNLARAGIVMAITWNDNGVSLDDLTREMMEAVAAIDRARARLRESMRRATP